MYPSEERSLGTLPVLAIMSKNKAKDAPKVPKTIENRKARHEYELVETHEAGIALAGSEVKSVFLGRVNMSDAYVGPLTQGGVKEIAPFAFMVIVLLFRPYGLWGWARIERV